MKIQLTILLLFVFLTSLYGQKYSVSGLVVDARTGETLVGATVLYQGSFQRGGSTNSNGLFTLTGLPSETGELSVSFIGYTAQQLSIQLNEKDKHFIEIRLEPAGIALDEVNIVGHGRDITGDRDTEVNRHELSTKAISSIPTARNDVFKAMRYLPGIESTEPFSPLLSVRGSDPGENMIMLDGTIIYNPYHFMSSSGTFNMQTIKGAEILAGGFGAEYGGRNASVINITTRDGDQSGCHGEIEPNTSESKVFMEFPMGEKTSMMVAGRINYDLFGNVLLYSNNYFYDANFSVTHRFSPRNRLMFKYFGSNDHTRLDFNALYRYMGNSMGMGMEDIFNSMSIKWQNHWNNNVASLIWKVMPWPGLYISTQLSASVHKADNYSEMVMNVENVAFDTSTRFRSRVNDYTGKIVAEYSLFHWNTLKTGLEYNWYQFFNGTELNRIELGEAQRNPRQFSAFIEDKVKIGPLSVRPGVRATNYNGQGFRLEPRISLTYETENGSRFKAAWGKYNQYIISMNTQEFEFNQFLDYYYPLVQADPSVSVHYLFGVEQQIGKHHTVQIDCYYKDIARTYVFDLLQSQSEAFALSDKIVAGQGRSMGIELLWKGSIGNFSGWGSYTLSKSERSFPHIMNGTWYAYDYDRRHSIKVVGNYQATRRIAYSASLLAQSGVPRSIENTFQMYYMYDPLTGVMTYSPQYTVDRKNGVRMPWLLYLDLGLRKEIVTGFGKELARFFKADQSYFTLNIYNVLFFIRNILYYQSIAGWDSYHYLPIGDNYLPVVSAGYTIKF